jgi:hypothetical protein
MRHYNQLNVTLLYCFLPFNFFLFVSAHPSQPFPLQTIASGCLSCRQLGVLALLILFESLH